MSEERVTRRDVLRKGATVSFIGVVAAMAPAEAAAAQMPANTRGIHAGRLIRIDSGRRAAIIAPDDSEIQVVLSDNATIKRGVSAETLDLIPFMPGEEVAVIGEQRGSVIIASQVMSVYRKMSGTVLIDHGADLVSTTAGVMYLDSETRARANIGRLSHGQQFSAEVWDNPANGRHEVFILRPENG